MTRERLEAILEKDGIEAALAEITFMRLAELRELAKEYGQTELTDRNLKRLSKGELLDVFRAFYEKT